MSSIKYKEAITDGRKEAVADAIAAAGELTEELQGVMRIVKDADAIPTGRTANIPTLTTDTILLFYQITKPHILKKYHSHLPKSFTIKQKTQHILSSIILILIITNSA